MSGHVRLTVLVNEKAPAYEVIVVGREDIVSLGDCGVFSPMIDRMMHVSVKTTRATYVVQSLGGLRELADRIWPPAPKCEKCGRPL